jgi:mycothiol synthase
MKPVMRNYQAEEDYWRIRAFLREIAIHNDYRDFSWSLLRWHVNENIFHHSSKHMYTIQVLFYT